MQDLSHGQRYLISLWVNGQFLTGKDICESLLSCDPLWRSLSHAVERSTDRLTFDQDVSNFFIQKISLSTYDKKN